MKIMLDLDGVFANFVKAFMKQALKLYPGCVENEDVEPNTWYFESILDSKIVHETFDAMHQVKNNLLSWEAYPENKDALLHIDWTEHDLYFVSSRSEYPGWSVAEQSRWWITQILQISPYDFSFIQIGATAADKARVARATGAHVSLDDKSENVIALAKVPDHHSFLLDRPYNRKGMNEYSRVYSVAEFLQRIGVIKFLR